MTHHRAFRDDINHEAIKRLVSKYKMKPRGNWLRQGICPRCEKKELYAHGIKPWAVKCGRTNKCAYETNIKELFPDLYENLNEKYRADSTNPNATADAYMDFKRR